MNIKFEYKAEVVYPGELPLSRDDEGLVMPFCKEHNEFYHNCTCPKPYSTPERDGWHVFKEGDSLFASPTKELYEAMALWIDVKDDVIKCYRCGEVLDMDEYIKEHNILLNKWYIEILGKVVDTFFDIHAECLEWKND